MQLWIHARKHRIHTVCELRCRVLKHYSYNNSVRVEVLVGLFIGILSTSATANGVAGAVRLNGTGSLSEVFDGVCNKLCGDLGDFIRCEACICGERVHVWTLGNPLGAFKTKRRRNSFT